MTDLEDEPQGGLENARIALRHTGSTFEPPLAVPDDTAAAELRDAAKDAAQSLRDAAERRREEKKERTVDERTRRGASKRAATKEANRNKKRDARIQRNGHEPRG